MSVSIFASSVRAKLWPSIFKSLEGTSVDYEVVFSGYCGDNDKILFGPQFIYETSQQAHYQTTGNIKPSQVYEIARRKCTKETIIWSADDAEYNNDVIGKAYKYWKEQNNEKLILSIQTKESGYGNPQGSLFNMDVHRFFGGDRSSPLMAPLGLMSRRFLDELGGIDRRYICGQYENDIVMRAYAQGGSVKIFGNKDCYIDIDHLGKSIMIGESTDENSFRERPFATGYEHDRSILQGSWCTLNKERLTAYLKLGVNQLMPSQMYDISPTQIDKFEPYENDISLIKSESNNIPELWD